MWPGIHINRFPSSTSGIVGDQWVITIVILQRKVEYNVAGASRPLADDLIATQNEDGTISLLMAMIVALGHILLLLLLLLLLLVINVIVLLLAGTRLAADSTTLTLSINVEYEGSIAQQLRPCQF